jgi:hypothetical protein
MMVARHDRRRFFETREPKHIGQHFKREGGGSRAVTLSPCGDIIIHSREPPFERKERSLSLIPRSRNLQLRRMCSVSDHICSGLESQTCELHFMLGSVQLLHRRIVLRHRPFCGGAQPWVDIQVRTIAERSLDAVSRDTAAMSTIALLAARMDRSSDSADYYIRTVQ